MRDDVPAAAVDTLIDDAARELTARVPPESLRAVVRRRTRARPPARGLPWWQPGLGLAVVALLALGLWPSSGGDAGVPERAAGADVVLLSEPRPGGAGPASEGGGASLAAAPRAAAPSAAAPSAVASRMAASRASEAGEASQPASGLPPLQDAPVGVPAPGPIEPPIALPAVGVDALRVDALGVEPIEEPVLLALEWIEIEPLALD